MSMQLIIILLVVAILGIIGLIHLLHGLFIDYKMTYPEETYSSPKVPATLDGYTIAFVTDTHYYSTKKLAEVVATIQARKPDLLLLGGDCSQTSAHAGRTIELLGQIHCPDGTYGVKGNHDRKNHLFYHMQNHGMIPLSNRGVPLHRGLFLAGTDDFRIGTPNIPLSVQNASAEDFILLLSHNPDTSMLPGGDLPDLVLSGHVHGGELRLFGAWSPLIPLVSTHGWRFSGGWCQSTFNTDVYVSNGVGGHSPVRIFCPPQTVFLTLRSSKEV